MVEFCIFCKKGLKESEKGKQYHLDCFNNVESFNAMIDNEKKALLVIKDFNFEEHGEYDPETARKALDFLLQEILKKTDYSEDLIHSHLISYSDYPGSDEYYNSVDEFIIHMNQVEDLYKFKCSICEERFESQENLNKHKKKHA
jgi:hypothetical protein